MTIIFFIFLVSAIACSSVNFYMWWEAECKRLRMIWECTLSLLQIISACLFCVYGEVLLGEALLGVNILKNMAIVTLKNNITKKQ
jgi:hypothetical protein